jgi:hypothetical protein
VPGEAVSSAAYRGLKETVVAQCETITANLKSLPEEIAYVSRRTSGGGCRTLKGTGGS